MGRIYNVILNSAAGVGTFPNYKTYCFDWNALPDGKYKLIFSYVGKVNNLVGDKVANIYVDLGCSKNYLVSGTNISAVPSQLIGSVLPFNLNTVSYLYATYTANPTVYLDTKPRNNTFVVQVLTNDAAPVPFTASAATALNDYTLILSFELLE
jgi:hypothetical protein